MTETEKIFIELLQVALGNRQCLSRSPKADEWGALYALAEKHAVVGVCWEGVKTLSDPKIPMAWVMEWMSQAEDIKARNREVNAAIRELRNSGIQEFKDGVVLKGQGLAQLYPQPELRTSGDIDYLVGDGMPTDELIGRLIRLARENGGMKEKACYHHCDFGKIIPAGVPEDEGVEVELHWRASWFYCPWTNRRFQEFTKKTLSDSPCLGGEEIPTPTLAFNRVYVLVHIYRHLFTEGIGLRQILDYYFVLVASSNGSNGDWEQEKRETMEQLKELGMERFTAAVMWVLAESLKLKEESLLCEPNEADGRFLLREIMQSGNFGKSDKRIRYNRNRTIPRGWGRIVRMGRIVRFGPWEVLWASGWKLWHQLWWIPRHNEKKE